MIAERKLDPAQVRDVLGRASADRHHVDVALAAFLGEAGESPLDGLVEDFAVLEPPLPGRQHFAATRTDEHGVLDPFHPFRDKPAAMPFLILLTLFSFITDGAGPHVGTGISASTVIDHIEFTCHE